MNTITNETEQVVAQMLNGFVHTHPQMDVVSKYKIIKKKYTNKNKVSLVSGGGCGHEPAHAGFIGKGMLDAAVYGSIFAPPSFVQVYQGIKETAGNKGTLLIINNFDDIVTSFRNAAYLAAEDGIEVDYVKVDDDIAVQDSTSTERHHCVAGTIFVHKIAGASAEKGKNLSEVKRVAEKTIKNIKSVCFPPKSDILPSEICNRLENVHDESNLSREKLTNSKNLAELMIDSISAELRLSAGQRIALLINGFGASPLMELYLLCNNALRILSNRGCIVSRTFVGSHMTDVKVNGSSISVLKLDSELEALLNAPCDTPALKVSGPIDIIPYRDKFASIYRTGHIVYTIETSPRSAIINDKLTLDNVIYLMDVVSESIIRNEAIFSEMDARGGRDNFGADLAKGFRQLKVEWKSLLIEPHLSISSFLDACSLIIMEHCSGALGPLWGYAIRAAGRSVLGKKSLTISDFAMMIKAAVKGIYDTGNHLLENGSEFCDKALVDALIPYANSWILNAKKGMNFYQAFRVGAQAAVNGTKNTNKVEKNISAYALGVIFTDVANAIK